MPYNKRKIKALHAAKMSVASRANRSAVSNSAIPSSSAPAATTEEPAVALSTFQQRMNLMKQKDNSGEMRLKKIKQELCEDSNINDLEDQKDESGKIEEKYHKLCEASPNGNFNRKESFYENIMKEEIKEEPLREEISLFNRQSPDLLEENLGLKSNTEMALQNDQAKVCDITGNENDELLASDASTSNPPTPIPTSSIKRMKKQTTNAMEQLARVIGERIQNMPREDEHNHFGKNLAAKLRKFPPTQRIYAEKLINDVMFAAELGQLNSTSFFNAGHVTIALPTKVEPSMSTPNPQSQTAQSLTGYFASFNSL